MADNNALAAMLMAQQGQAPRRYDPADRSRAYAAKLMEQGSSTAPVQSWGEGLARALTGVAGGVFGGMADRAAEEKQQRNTEGLLDYAGVKPEQRAALRDLDPQTAASLAIMLIGQKQQLDSANNTFNAKPPVGGADPSAGLGGISSGSLPQAGAPAPDQATFLQNMSQNARTASAQTGLDPRVVLAQTALETGYGKNAPGNNFFGVKGPGQVLATNEAGPGGGLVPTQDSFRTYPDAAASTQGYVDVMKQPNMAAILQQPGMTGQIAALGKSGYATDPQYAAKVGAIANSLSPLDPTDPQSAFVQGRPGLAGAPGFSPSPVPAQAVPGGLPQMPVSGQPQVAQAPGAPPVTVQATPPAAVTTLPVISDIARDLEKQAQAARASGTLAGVTEANRLMDEAHKAQSAHAIKRQELIDTRTIGQQTEAQKNARELAEKEAATAAANVEHDRRRAADEANKPLTESQAKAGEYHDRMRNAAATVDQYEARGRGPGAFNANTKNLPIIGTAIQSKEDQAYNAAQLDWASAKLRAETGANAPEAEVREMARRYFPQPGEGPEIVKQKAQQRAVAEEAIKRAAGPNYKYTPAPVQPLPGSRVKVSSPEEARKLKSGTLITLPDGSEGVVP